MKKVGTILCLIMASFAVVSVIGLAQTFSTSTTKIIPSTEAAPVVIDTSAAPSDGLLFNLASFGDLHDRKPVALIEAENPAAHHLSLCLMGSLLTKPVLNRSISLHFVSSVYSGGSLDYNLASIAEAGFVLSFTGPIIENLDIEMVELDDCLPTTPKQAQLSDRFRFPAS